MDTATIDFTEQGLLVSVISFLSFFSSIFLSFLFFFLFLFPGLNVVCGYACAISPKYSFSPPPSFFFFLLFSFFLCVQRQDSLSTLLMRQSSLFGDQVVPMLEFNEADAPLMIFEDLLLDGLALDSSPADCYGCAGGFGSAAPSPVYDASALPRAASPASSLYDSSYSDTLSTSSKAPLDDALAELDAMSPVRKAVARRAATCPRRCVPTEWPDDVLELDTKELNLYIKRHGLSPAQARDLKTTRRRLKNRQYARVSRDRKHRLLQTL